jgi:hypothetical protein
MIRLLGFAFLALPMLGRCEWIPTSSGEGEQAWIETESIGPKGKYTKAWLMIGYTKPQSGTVGWKPYLSEKLLMLFDCRERTLALLQRAAYSGIAGEGEIVGTVSQDISVVRFIDVIPGTTGEARLAHVCARKSSK